ncbi:NAD-dependent epimerase/dehydratase family protein [Flaviaesturariibacter aridisoli]|uniref:SDR family oxidoreductase n=1 Tax=Flaviaesturariibacter aridisoli TaxID=2545761 RepID=A0A4R4E537_9BACT|nr:SDR family oxidoreductase [Flaviaesturariibacter aridisoli]TCZ73131.1 SDR family oxidoreductase [Flaviaesturariibacter aridisoli]
MNKVAVFGSNGYLGQHMVHYLLREKGAVVTGFDLADAYAGSDSIAYRRMDITKPADVQTLEEGFDTIYYFTGLTGTDISFDRYELFVSVNELGLLHLLQHLRGMEKKPKIVFPSTRLVYKGAEGKPLAEDDEKEFKTIYASSKYNGEQYLAMYRNLFGLDYTVFRVCVPYANLVAGALSYGTVGFFLGKAQNGEAISLFGDGGLKRTFTHVWDICRQVVEVSALPESSGCVFNTDGETFSLKEAAGLIAGKYGVELRYVPWPEKALQLESGDTIFDGSRIRSLFPNTLTFSLQEWIHA